MVNSFSVKELQSYTIANEHQIPTLKEVIELVGSQCWLNIEIKNADATIPLIALIEDYVNHKKYSYDSFIVSSFDWNSLLLIHRSNPNINIGVLTETDLDLAFSFAKFINAHSIHPDFKLLLAENDVTWQDEKINIFPWTVNNPEDIEKLKLMNVDGIITDFPDRI